MDHMHEAGAALRPASDIDDKILALWRGLRSNPSLDARCAMQAIDRLLDERPRLGQIPPTAMSLGLPTGSPAQEAILASVVRELLTEEPRLAETSRSNGRATPRHPARGPSIPP